MWHYSLRIKKKLVLIWRAASISSCLLGTSNFKNPMINFLRDSILDIKPDTETVIFHVKSNVICLDESQMTIYNFIL